ncbi:YrhK family protein [Bacillus sp. SCS-153A]|uniref:YrhK family protein n=1 Tax=Rossellomorea sedimentorum TaxID=3115294 RepID=UPI003906AC4B
MFKKLKNRLEKFEDYSLQIHLSRKKKMVIGNRYRIIGYFNDTLLGILYMIGSILFITDAERILATSFFLGGSFMMIFRALIHILRDIHMKRFTEEDLKNNDN